MSEEEKQVTEQPMFRGLPIHHLFYSRRLQDMEEDYKRLDSRIKAVEGWLSEMRADRMRLRNEMKKESKDGIVRELKEAGMNMEEIVLEMNRRLAMAEEEFKAKGEAGLEEHWNEFRFHGKPPEEKGPVSEGGEAS